MFSKLMKNGLQAARSTQGLKATQLTVPASASFARDSKKPARVTVTGGAGQIGYALLFRIASGEMLGKDQPVILQLLDLPNSQQSLNGVKLELNDCSFPLLHDVICTDSPATAFKDSDYALLVGAKPRGKGQERADLLKDNGKIFIETGKAINDNASRDVKVLVVGNPANTNCLIASHYAKDIPKENFTAMTRLDHNRAVHQLAHKTNSHMYDIENFAVWGNHSPTMYPDITNTTVKGKKASDQVDRTWVDQHFLPVVQQRGAEIIKARNLSSAASAGHAAIEHIRDWVHGSRGWTSMAVTSNGNPYGVPEGLIYSFPVTCGNGKWEIVKGLKWDDYSKQKIEKTTNELLEERKAVEALLK